MRSYFLAGLILAISFGYNSLYGQQNVRIGEWQSYLSHNRGVQSVKRDNFIYTITGGGMIEYDEISSETRTFSTIEGLSGITPTTIYYEESSDLIFLGYPDGMINYFSDPEEIRFISDIERNDFYTQKQINQFVSSGDRLFIATDFGMVIYNLQSLLPELTVTQLGDNPSRTKVSSIGVYSGNIWALLEGRGIYSAPADFPTLSDPIVWIGEDGIDGLPATLEVLEIGANSRNIYARADTAIFKKENGMWSEATEFTGLFANLEVQETGVAASFANRTLVYVHNGPTYNIFIDGSVNHTLITGEVIYIADRFFGLKRYENGESVSITPGGPSNNNCFRVAANNGEIYVAPGGHDEAFGPTFDGSGVYFYSREKGWVVSNRLNGGLPRSRANFGYARVFYDPNNRETWLGSWGRGISRFLDGEFVDFFDCENSGVSTIDGDCDTTALGNSRVSGLQKDTQGNLWVTMSLAQEPLLVMTTDGEWHQVPSNRFTGGLNFIDLIIDDYGGKWILNRGNGIVVYNDNGTPENFNDDRPPVYLKSGINQGALPSNDVFSIAKDLDGFIWVGTRQGVFVFYDPFSISQGQIVDGACPAINLQCLLKDETINAIAVDGGNRKWMATTNGVFLVSEDGDEVIQQFTTENSPLLSNRVNDVSVDPTTGEVFFATSLGLVSYRGDATAGANPCEEVLVFPNPVFTDFDGLITIQGAGRESKVRITTVSGMLVRELDSEGGTATWDGLDVYGKKVHSGIYLALMANRDGENACIGKFAVIQR